MSKPGKSSSKPVKTSDISGHNMSKDKISIFIFRRDFRLEDNTSLIKLIDQTKGKVMPIFIFTPEQTNDNKLRSDPAVQFMVESLNDLRSRLNNKLTFYYGSNLDILGDLIKRYSVEYIGYNQDYTPYAMKRDKEVRSLADKHNVKIISEEDYTLLPMDKVRTKSNSYYKVFGPYYRNVMDNSINEPKESPKSLYIADLKGKFRIDPQSIASVIKYKYKENSIFVGSRTKALTILNNIKEFNNYESKKDTPSINTTLLSPYIKFGLVSIREVYHSIRRCNITQLNRQVIWHDYYAQLMKNLPADVTLEADDKKNYKSLIIGWDYSNADLYYEKWTRGQTGFPLIDAGMRHMNQTGWMHNRVRMNVANFLSTILLVPWKRGEEYFTSKLIDYDPASNNLNWSSEAQLGVANPSGWPRIYNPWKQLKDHDPQCIYVKQWVEELKDVPVKDILKWDQTHSEYEINYPNPIVDYQEQKKKSKDIFHKARLNKA